MTNLSDTLASYIPNLIVRRLAANPEPITAPTFETYRAAAMYADITGFTALTERLDKLPLAERGAGAEELTRVINAYFEQLINLIIQYRGDIVKFTGDGMLALWLVREDEEPHSLENAVLLAGQCGLEVQARLNEYQMEDGTQLFMRLGVGAGDINILHLGGVFERWELLVAGEPIMQTSAAEKLAKPGHIVLSPEAHALVRDFCSGNPIIVAGQADLGAQDTALQLTRVDEPIRLPPPTPIHYDESLTASLRPFIPQAIYRHIDAGLSAWLAELRRITVLFINLPDLDHTTESALAEAQLIMQRLQKTVYTFEGSINKLNVDDKGATLIAAYGLPPLGHENDPERGVKAALALQKRIQEMGMRGSIGVATGLTFCGVIGSTDRREYTMMGDAVNLSARLMQAASHLDPKDGVPILCDPNTFHGAQFNLNFQALEPILVKGKQEPIPIYRPLGEKKQRALADDARSDWGKMLVGRHEERFDLAESLQSLQRGGRGSTYIIEGEAGIGKSRLIQDLLEQAAAVGVRQLSGAGNSIDRETLYLAWRPVLNTLFNMDATGSGDSRTKHRLPEFLKIFVEIGVGRLAPLLSDVLNLGIADNEVTSQMVGQVRAENTRDLLVRILQQACDKTPTVLVIEDAQWIDSASWALLKSVWSNVTPLFLIVATRPIPDPTSDYLQIVLHPNTHHFPLGPLSAEDALDLVCRVLDVPAIPNAVAAMIQAKAEGHPFYSEELAYSLRDNGVLKITDGLARLAPGADLAALSFPDTVQGVVTSRIDRLDPTEKLTLKVASVLGRNFSFPTLFDIHPILIDKPRIRQDLDALGRLDMTALEFSEPEASYIFKHLITQEVSYNMMSFAQRQQLHSSAAGWYEERFAEDLSPVYSLLAHHWSKAGVAEKAIHYYELAGGKALLGGAYREANRALREAIDWNRKAHREPPREGLRLPLGKPPPEYLFREASWFRQSGEAYLGLGQLPESRTQFLTALELMGSPAAYPPLRLIGRTLGQLARQAWFRLFPQRAGSAADALRPVLAERARAFRMMGEISFFENDTLGVVHDTVTSLNFNERVGKSPDLAELYGNMGLIMSFISLHKYARFYFRRGRETAASVERPASKAYVGLVNGLYAIGIGDWPQVDEVVGEAASIFRAIGDRRRLGEALSIQSMTAHLQANYMGSIELYQQVLALGKQTDNVQQETWGIDGQAVNYFRMGEFDEAARLMASAAPLLEVSKDVSEEFIFTANQAVLALYQKDLDRAFETARRGLEMQQHASSVYSMLEGYAGIAEVLMTLWEKQYQPAEPFDIPTAAGQTCKAFGAYARRFPIGKPRSLAWQGLNEWLSGSHEKSHRTWARALTAARALHMPYEEALAHKLIGQHLAEMVPGHKEHLAEFRRICEQLGARADLIGP